MFYKKKMLGGDGINSNPKMEKFLGMIIVGYFIIKIVYPLFFNYYPEKYYFRNIQINTNERIHTNRIDGESESNTENITLNAYAPGMWNNEMSDFITLIVLCYIIFIFTQFSSKCCIDIDGHINLVFLIGYIIGLGSPIFKSIVLRICSHQLSNKYYIFVFIFIFYIVFINFLSIKNENANTSKTNYLIFVFAILLLFLGMLYTRKQTSTYSIVKYFYNDGESCAFKKINNSSVGVLESSGEQINITYPFVVFLILLLFSYEPSDTINKNIYIFFYGLLLGVLVSYISYFGFQYFLEKKPMQECSNRRECRLKEIANVESELEEEYIQEIRDKTGDYKDKASDYVNQILSKHYVFKLFILIFIIIAIIYLIYFHFKK